MADQKRWFKVWTSLPVDMDNVPDHLIGKWTRLGCRAALVGNSGTVLFDSWKHVAEFLKVPTNRAKQTLQRLPSVSVEEGEKCNGKVAVTFRKWRFYQEDSTSAQRVRSLRSKRRGEEIREEEKRTTPLPPPRTEAVTTDPEPPGLIPTPPPAATGPLDCDACQRVLTRLNERTARTYTAPGHVGRMLHDRHEQFGVEACLRVVDVKVDECERTGQGWKFIGPNVLFKPENFDTYRNQGVRAVPMESPDEREFLASLRPKGDG